MLYFFVGKPGFVNVYFATSPTQIFKLSHYNIHTNQLFHKLSRLTKLPGLRAFIPKIKSSYKTSYLREFYARLK